MHQSNTSVLSASAILIVICGPTATGKSGLAMVLAQALSGEILSADSRQVYREFDIGTAKPTLADRQTVPHHLIDICSPTDTLTVADFQQQAQTLISSCHQSGSIPLIVGGTGLYIKSIVQGMQIPTVPPQPQLRSQLEALGQTCCYAMLKQVDPVAAQKIHPNDRVRTLRSLEVFYITGKPISQQQGQHPPSYPILQIGLDCDIDTIPTNPTGPTKESDRLTQRIQQRTVQMVKDGFVEEVDRLCCKYGEDLPLLKTLGYQEFMQHRAGVLSLEEAQALTVLHTRQFAKRQRTWFRANPEIEWFDCDRVDLVDVVERRVKRFMRSGE